MKLAAVLCLAFVASNEAFFTDTLTDLGNLVKDKILPGLVQTGLTTLITGAIGKRDVESESLALLEDAVTDRKERMEQMKEFVAKLAEARKNGNVKEFLQKYREEQKQKWLARLTPEQKKKYEQHIENLKQMQAKMQAYQKKMEACRAEVKTAQEAAAKTDDKTDGSRRELIKVYTDCLKKASQKTEETKTQEDFSSLVESLKNFREQFNKAKESGKLQEFLKTHHENLKTKLTELRQKAMARLTTEQKQRLEQHKSRMTALSEKVKACSEKAKAMKDASRVEQMKSYVKCMMPSKKTEEKKTETQSDFRGPHPPRMTAAERAEFMKKYEEAKKAGNLKEFLQKHHEEMRAKMEEMKKQHMAKVEECKKKVEEQAKASTAAKFDKKRAMQECMMTEEQKQAMEMKRKCYEEAKAKKAEAEQKKEQFTRTDFYKIVKDCVKEKMEEKKTQTQSDFSRMTAEERAEYKKKYEEAKKAGKLREFFKAQREERMEKMKEAQKARMAKYQECQKKVAEQVKADAKVNKGEAMRQCMMTDEQKMKQKCYEAAKAKKVEAVKAKTAFTHTDFYRTIKECMQA